MRPPKLKLELGKGTIMKVSMKYLLVTLSIAGLVTAVWMTSPAGTSGSADPGNVEKVAMGGDVYRDNCASCHSANLEGQPNWRVRKPDGRLPAPPHDKNGHTWHHSDKHLFNITKFGLKPPLAPEGYQSDMPAFGDVLKDDEIWAVLAFIKKSWPPRERDRQNQINEATPK
jgi:mono/diheme cytochrome c family protein